MDERVFGDLDGWDPRPLRQSLAKAGFMASHLEALGFGSVASIQSDAGLVEHEFEDGDPLGTAIRLFLLAQEVEVDPALRLLGVELSSLCELGLLEAKGGKVAARFQLSPQAEGWVVSDFLSRQHHGEGDYVMGVGPSSRLLAALISGRGRGRFLELGCGVGWLSGRFCHEGWQVTASDLNARALDLAKFNARLAGVDGIEWVKSDLFAGLKGRKYDRIAANLPYVQSPGGSLMFREAPEGEEGICLRALRSLNDHLETGGLAVALIHWCHSNDDDWRERPLQVIPEDGVRRWLFQSDCAGPGEYARRWLRGDPRFRGAALGVEFERWMKFYRERGIHRISSGFVVLQACEQGEEWSETDSRAAGGIQMGAGEELRRIFDNRSWLRQVSENLLDLAFRPAAGIHAEMQMQLQGAHWQRRTIRLTSPGKLAYDGQIDENLMRLLELFGQGRTGGEMVAELRQRADFARQPGLEEEVSELVRQLLRYGLLEVPTEKSR
ncbi:methylase of polypeptide subunit release factors [Haloferula luteola]|uniref:Methylase of polypeptide subunit release factors n=1 Tax=Haloferula luteola TaxID=595692 RepID=A0A840VG45_9BACT|nr:methyltransferase [Haloferula luteola]MBB5352800.1 methylase of polypeptide subunit release factors [Haloferula luteola]